MPAFDVVGTRLEIGSGLVKFVIEIQIEMMRLQVHNKKHRRHRSGELTECVIHIVGLQGQAVFKTFIVSRCGRPNSYPKNLAGLSEFSGKPPFDIELFPTKCCGRTI